MAIYDIITRREVFRDSQAHFGLLLGMIAQDGLKPNLRYLKEVESNLKSSNESKSLEIFKTLKSLMESCWCFDPKSRLDMKQGTRC